MINDHSRLQTAARAALAGLALAAASAIPAQAQTETTTCTFNKTFDGGETVSVWLKGENGEVVDDFAKVTAKPSLYSFANDAEELRGDDAASIELRYDLSGPREPGAMTLKSMVIKLAGFAKPDGPANWPEEQQKIAVLYPGGLRLYTADAKMERWSTKPDSREMALTVDLNKNLRGSAEENAATINSLYASWQTYGTLIVKVFDPGQEKLPSKDNTQFAYMYMPTSGFGAVPIKALEGRVLEYVEAQTAKLKAGTC